MINLEIIKEKIQNALPRSTAIIREMSHNPEHEGRHVEAIVTYSGFKGKNLVEQHKMIYDILKKELQEDVHALKLTTKEN